MISDHPDEDADNLDDEDLLETYLGAGAPIAEAGEAGMAGALDWPASRAPDVGLEVNVETLAWFKANHEDWQLAIDAVLRAWVGARTRERPEIQPRG